MDSPRASLLRSGSVAPRSVDVGWQVVFGNLNQRRECRRFVHCEFSEDLAVNLDTSCFQALDEAVVRHVVGANRSVDALDPETTEVALADLAVAVVVDERVSDLL